MSHLPESFTSSRQTAPRICIVGGGFGGLYTALYLQKYRHLRSAQITLIEPKDRFLFTPMMYELITDELKEWEIAPTYSSLLAGTSVTWQQTHAESVDLQHQTVTVAGGRAISYDYLVLATGAHTRTVDIPGVDQHTLTFRSLEDALTLKARLSQLVQAQALQTERNSSPPIYINVIGGGASGVELAGKVSDYLGARGQITLIERGSTILKPFEKGLRRLGQQALARRQVTVLTETSVASVSADAVTVQVGEAQRSLPSHLTLWAVGTQPRPWLGSQSVDHNERGQRLTRRSLQLLSYDNVFVLGDTADVKGSQQKSAPDTAQAAFQAASRVAANLAAMTKGKHPKPFNYLHLGDMVTLGVGDAGLWSFGITLGGRFAALCRRGVYIFRMPTRRHQLKVGRRALGELGRAMLRPWRSRSRPSYES
ncbi:MAG: NAD(P)/FAD-dependent oxidoreductase [Phormidesmis sp.]